MAISLLAALLGAALGGLCWMGLSLYETRRKYGPLIDADARLMQRRQEVDTLLRQQQDLAAALVDERRRAEDDIKRERDAFTARYIAAKETYDRLQREVALLEASSDEMSSGVYKPQFDFKTSAEYKAKLEAIYKRQKALVKEGAVKFGVEWQINGSRAEGVKMQKQYAKLMLRGFNGECDAATAKVAWNNVNSMIERVRKSFESFNALGGVMNISLTPQYMELKLEELRDAFELEEKKHAELEEQRRIRTQMREEEKAQREIDLAKKKAEEDEARYAKALAEARAHAAQASGAELDKLNGKIDELQKQLSEAQQNKARAISRAQMTRSGHLYIVSNIGSFGEGVYKIGMTRRLDPLERVQELSDASVPFSFDVHGMIYSDDVPALETAIHQHFQERQLNRMNPRKEFFRLSLDDLATFAKSRQLTLDLTMLAEAKEYRQTMAMAAQNAQATQAPETSGIAAPPLPAFPHGVLS